MNVFYCPYADVFERVVEQAGAQAHTETVLFQDRVVSAAPAAFPELRIAGEFGEGYGSESHLVVDLHHSGSCGDAEYPGEGEQLAGEQEDLLLNPFGQSDSPELVGDNEAGIGYVPLAFPRLNVGESGEPSVFGDGYYGFPGLHFSEDIFGSSLCDASTSLLCGDVHLIADLLRETVVAAVSHHDVNSHFSIIGVWSK